MSPNVMHKRREKKLRCDLLVIYKCRRLLRHAVETNSIKRERICPLLASADTNLSFVRGHVSVMS